MNNDELFNKLYVLLSILDRNMIHYITNNPTLYDCVINNPILLNLFIIQHYYLQNIIKLEIDSLEKMILPPILEIPEILENPESQYTSPSILTPLSPIIPYTPTQSTPLNPNASEFFVTNYYLPSNLLDFTEI